MKKKLLLLVLVLVIGVMAFAGCASDKEYISYITNYENLTKAMGDEMLYPVLAPEGKFFDPKKYENVAVIPEDAMNNVIKLIHFPPLTTEQLNAIHNSQAKGNVAYDAKAYRYSLTLTRNKNLAGEKLNGGSIVLYVHGSDYSRVKKSKETGDIKFHSVANFKKDKESAKKGDKDKLNKDGQGKYFVSKIETIGGVEVYVHENKRASELVRYFTVIKGDKKYSYTMTASIKVNNDVKKEAFDKTYEKLLEASREYLDYILMSMISA